MDSYGATGKTGRKVYIDAIKIIAIYMVLFNHTGAHGFVLFTVRQHSMFYPFYLFNAVFIKIAVPLFFMSSGALLLKRRENYGSILKKFIKFGVVLIVISFIYYLYDCFYLKSLTFSVSDFLTRLYTKPISVALWYLYVYLALILMLPIMQILAANMRKKDFQWVILVYGLFRLLPVIEFTIWQGSVSHYGRFSLFIAADYFIYPLIGYYIDQINIRGDRKKEIICLIALSFTAIVLCCVLTHMKCNLTGEWSESSCQTYFNTLIFLPASTVFYVFRCFFEICHPHEIICRIITALGGATFGLFLIEKFCRIATRPVFAMLNTYIPTIIACWIWILTAVVSGLLITMFLKRIPVISGYI